MKSAPALASPVRNLCEKSPMGTLGIRIGVRLLPKGSLPLAAGPGFILRTQFDTFFTDGR